jgi:hypothetical protein
MSHTSNMAASERNPGRCLRRTKAYIDIRQANDRGDDSEVPLRSSNDESDAAGYMPTDAEEVPAKKRRKVMDKATIRRALQALQDAAEETQANSKGTVRANY